MIKNIGQVNIPESVILKDANKYWDIIYFVL